jgi:zinc protease
MRFLQKLTALIFLFGLISIFQYSGISLSADNNPFDVKNDYFTLDNGLKVVVKRDNKDRNISLTTAFRFGAAYDIKGKDGYAHFTFMVVERMISRFFNEDYQKILNEEGAIYFSQFDRNTASFTTIFSKNDLDSVLKIELLRMSLESIDPEEFESVKRLKMSEFLKGEDQQPENIIRYNMNGVNNIFWEYYHRFEGKETDIQVARIQDIERFVRWYYSPSNAAIVIKGPVEKSQIVTKIKEIFSALPKSDIIPRNPVAFSLSQDIIRLQYEDPQIKNPAISFSYRIPPVNHEDYPAVKIIYNLLFDKKDSRFGRYADASKVIQDYYTAITDSGGPNLMGAVFYLPDSAYFDSITDIVNENLKEITDGKFTNDEFIRAKRRTQSLNNESLNPSNYTNTIARLLLIFGKASDIVGYFNSYSGITRQILINDARVYLANINSCIVYSKK